MNYFAHAIDHLHDPWFVAGTALPDWLNVADRGLRVRPRHAAPFADDADPCLASLARGILRHHHDDSWFHATAAFHDLQWRLARLVRDALPGDEGFRPSFLGHILVEILLDATLIERQPERLEEYYAALGRLDAALLETHVNRIGPRPTDRIAGLLPMFIRERFLFDYADDDRLCRRLNQVMRRVGLPELPPAFADVLPQARARVGPRCDELLAAPEVATMGSSRGGA